MEDPAAAPDEDAAGDVIRVEEEVVRDLRHSIGNHFHKLYYWADRMGSETDSEVRAGQAEELEQAIHRLQEYLELALRYFEPDRPSLLSTDAEKIAQSMQATLRGEIPGAVVEVEASDEVKSATVKLDPQRFSAALQLIGALLGGARKGCAWRIQMAVSGGALQATFHLVGGEAAVEVPVVEWAIARKAMAMQGGTLRLSGSAREPAGCILKLPLVR